MQFCPQQCQIRAKGTNSAVVRNVLQVLFCNHVTMAMSTMFPMFFLVVFQRELSDLRAVVLHLRKMGWTVNCVLGHSKGKMQCVAYVL